MPSGKPTLRDVAKAAGVSPMTASNALHGKPGVKDSTRAKVLAVAEKLDYRINLTASMLKSGRSNIIHIIVNEFDSPFYSKLVESLVTETTARGLTPFVEQTRYSPDAAKHALANNPFSGQLFDGAVRSLYGLPRLLLSSAQETRTICALEVDLTYSDGIAWHGRPPHSSMDRVAFGGCSSPGIRYGPGYEALR